MTSLPWGDGDSGVPHRLWGRFTQPVRYECQSSLHRDMNFYYYSSLLSDVWFTVHFPPFTPSSTLQHFAKSYFWLMLVLLEIILNLTFLLYIRYYTSNLQ
ncbi:hypothetical protein BDV32DRAFT_118449 [Aspergillus pseudonomiae]|nr:hypothetical protein BDV32DRAFT_118449 [Aspergillus pseudonomiae]